MKKFVLGITGPSGSGKSLVSEYLGSLGGEVLNADEINHNLLSKDTIIIEKIRDAFGEEIIHNNEINRQKLGNIVFNNDTALKKLTNITFPFIHKKIVEMIYKSKSPFIVLDAPTLFEAELDTICNEVWCVLADKEKRLERLLTRDNISEQEILARLTAQPNDVFYIEKSDRVLYNNTTIDDLYSFVDIFIKETGVIL